MSSIFPSLFCFVFSLELFTVTKISDTIRLGFEQLVDVDEKKDEKTAENLRYHDKKAENEKTSLTESLQTTCNKTFDAHEHRLHANPGENRK